MTHANDNTPPTRPTAFDQRLLQFDRLITSECRKKAIDETEAEDLRSMVYERALSKWQRFREDGNFFVWILYLIREVRSEQCRKRVRREGHEHKLYQPPTEAPQEYAVDIGNALDALPQAEREAVAMIAAGHNGPETAKAMGRSRRRVWQLMESGRARLAANDNATASAEHKAEKPRLRA